MPDEYIDIPLETDPDAIVQDAYRTIQAVYPDWKPEPADLEVILLEIAASMAAEDRDVASSVARSIFRYFGNSIANIPPIDAIPAIGYTTWTARDNAGYTIEANTIVGVPGHGGGNDLIPFTVDQDVIIPPGQTQTAAGAVLIKAVHGGADGTNLSGTQPGNKIKLITALDFIVAVALTGPTVDGLDAETDDAYLDRLTAELSLQSPRPILARDHAELIRAKIPGIHRATYIDNYIPANAPNGGQVNAQGNVPRAVTVSGIDIAGNPVDAPTKAAAIALLQSEREINFIINILDAVLVELDVTFHAVAWPGFDPVAVSGGMVTALQSYLGPSVWGSSRGTGNVPKWYNTPIVKFNDVLAELYQVPGVRNVLSLSMGLHGGALSGGDIDLGYPIPLPQVVTITPTVDASS